MSDESVLWEGVPIETLSREKLMETVRYLMNEQRHWVDVLNERRKMDRRKG